MQTLYYGGDIITMKGKEDFAEAVLVEDAKILYVGSYESAKKSVREEVVYRDLKGKTLMPSFIDPHGHISMVAQFASFANLSECKSFKDIIETLKAYKEKNHLSKEDVMIGCSYDHNFLEEQCHPDKLILDEVDKEIPIFIFHTSAHMGVANSKLLQIAHVDEMTEDPVGAKFGRVDEGKEPNGYAEEGGAITKVLSPIFKYLMGDGEKQILEAQQIYLKNGITTVQDGAASKENIKGLVKFAENDLLKLDVIAYPMVQDEWKKVMETYKGYNNQYSNHLKIGGLKMILDGSPQGKSAWLTKPYEGETDYLGYPTLEHEEVLGYVQEVVDSGYQLLAHCNGDAASDQYIKCYKEVLESSKNPKKNELRPVMIHCQTVRNDQLDEMAKLNMIPSIFVAHTYYWGDVHLKNLGEERGNHISPARSALERGLCINFHQDPPVVLPNVLHTVWCAVNRQTRLGKVIGIDERIDVYDALKAVTINGAYEYFEETQKGTLEVGKLADMVVLDQNPLKVGSMSLKDIQVLETIKEGEVVYVCN